MWCIHIVIHILQTRKLGLREVKRPAYGHQSIRAGVLIPEPELFYPVLEWTNSESDRIRTLTWEKVYINK